MNEPTFVTFYKGLIEGLFDACALPVIFNGDVLTHDEAAEAFWPIINLESINTINAAFDNNTDFIANLPMSVRLLAWLDVILQQSDEFGIHLDRLLKASDQNPGLQIGNMPRLSQ